MKKKIVVIIASILVLSGVFFGCNHTYTITFDSNNGSFVDNMIFDKNFVMPTPTKQDHTFDGWFFDNDTFTQEFTKDSKITKNTTVYAKWTPNTQPTDTYYTVSFRDYNGDVLTVNGKLNQTILSGQSATAPTVPTRTGYTFTGWSEDFSSVSSNLIIYATYSINSYQVTYISQGEVIQSRQEEYGTTLGQNINLTRDGFTFEGWCSDESLINKITKVPANAITVYADWRFVPIEGFSIYSDKTLNTLTYGETVTLTADHAEGITTTYQWYLGNQLLEGQTERTLTITPAVTEREYTVIMNVGGQNPFEARAYIRLTVNQKELFIAVNNLNITYGQTPEFTTLISGLIDTDTIDDLDQIEFSHSPITSIGTYTVSASGGHNPNYQVSYITGTLTVLRAELTVTAHDKQISFFDTVSEFTYQIDGFVFDENQSVLSGQASLTTTYRHKDSAGDYEISIFGLTAQNYSITYVAGTLTVIPLQLDVTLPNTTIIYRDDISLLSLTNSIVVYRKNGEEIKLENGVNDTDLLLRFVLSLDADFGGYYIGAGAGEYSINLFINRNATNAQNFDWAGTNATLSVQKRAVEIVANAINTTYGKIPTYTYTAEGYHKNDTQIILGSDYDTTPTANTFEIKLLQADTANYQISFHSAQLVATKATLNITISSAMRQNGLPYSISDFNGDFNLQFDDIIVGQISTTSSANKTYSFFGSDLSQSSDYEGEIAVQATHGDVTASYNLIFDLSIEISDQAIEYFVKQKSVTFNGNNHNVDILVLSQTQYQINYSLDNQNFTDSLNLINAGEYKIYFEIISTELGYANTYGSTHLTINKKQVSITVDNKTTTFNSMPTYTYQAQGLVGQDTLAGIELSCTYQLGDSVGEYQISASAQPQQNYEITTITFGTLTVEKAIIPLELIPASPTINFTYTVTTLNAIPLPEFCRWIEPDLLLPNASNNIQINVYFNPDPTNYFDAEIPLTLNIAKGTLTISNANQEHDLTIASSTLDGVVVNPITINATATNNQHIQIPVDFDYGDIGNTFTTGGTYKITVSLATDAQTNWQAEPVTFFVKIKSVMLNNTLYTIEDALNLSKANDTIIITTNTQFALDTQTKTALYNADSFYTLKRNATLLVPFSPEYVTRFDSLVSEITGSNNGATSQTPYVNLTLNSKLTVLGTLNVNGNIGAYGEGGGGTSGQSGNTCNYGMMTLNQNAIVEVLNGGIFNATGFVVGEGEVKLLNGSSANEVFQLLDYPGGTITSLIKSKMLPFNQYTIQNFECALTVNKGASVNAIAFIHSGATALTSPIKLMGAGTDCILQLTDGYLTRTYSQLTRTTTSNLYGKLSLNYLTINISIFNVSAKDMFTAVPPTLAIVAKAGSVLTINTAIKLMPASLIHIEEDAQLIANDDIFVYDQNQLSDFIEQNKPLFGYPKTNLSIRGFVGIPDNINYTSAEQGNLIIDGLFIANANVAGPISTTLADGTPRIHLYGTTNVTVLEHYGAGLNVKTAEVEGTLSNVALITLNNGKTNMLVGAIGTQTVLFNPTSAINPPTGGATLEGWYYNGAYTQKITAPTAITANTTLYSKWN